MKVKELQAILETMNPDTELSLYCGGEHFYEDYPLNGIECFEPDGFIVFNLTQEGKYGIGRQIDMEDFESAIDCLDGNAFAIDYEDREKLRLTFEDALANNDTYNAIYNETLEEVIRQECPKIFEEEN